MSTVTQAKKTLLQEQKRLNLEKIAKIQKANEQIDIKIGKISQQENEELKALERKQNNSGNSSTASTTSRFQSS